MRNLPLLIQRDCPAALPLVEQCASELEARVPPLRDAVMLKVGADALDLEKSTRNLQAMRWLARVSQVSQHLCRITQHFSRYLGC